MSGLLLLILISRPRRCKPENVPTSLQCISRVTDAEG
jgi:hypothetical protein